MGVCDRLDAHPSILKPINMVEISLACLCDLTNSSDVKKNLEYLLVLDRFYLGT